MLLDWESVLCEMELELAMLIEHELSSLVSGVEVTGVDFEEIEGLRRAIERLRFF